MKKDYFECQCHSNEHVFSFVYWKEDDGEKCLAMEVHLTTYRNVFKRIWAAIQYICGHKSNYGHWDSTLIVNDEIPALIKVLEQGLPEDECEEQECETDEIAIVTEESQED